MNKCGDCYYWMKSSECPRERNVKGRNRGPSISGSPCEKFRPDAEPAPEGGK